jgi:hypothetical protein
MKRLRGLVGDHNGNVLPIDTTGGDWRPIESCELRESGLIGPAYTGEDHDQHRQRGPLTAPKRPWWPQRPKR